MPGFAAPVRGSAFDGRQAQGNACAGSRDARDFQETRRRPSAKAAGGGEAQPRAFAFGLRGEERLSRPCQGVVSSMAGAGIGNGDGDDTARHCPAFDGVRVRRCQLALRHEADRGRLRAWRRGH